MTTLRKSILIGLTVIGMGTVSLAAQAQAPAEGRHGQAARTEAMQAKMGELFAKRQAKIHDLLKLTAAQEAAWTTYQAAIKPSAPTAHPDHAAIAAMSAPARMEKHIAMAKEHIIKMEAHLAALNTFYATLTADQKKIFDANTLGGEHGGMGMRARMMRMHQG
ncbi:MAG: Spy/CpxP family protein refolding chaperone [Pseudomonadota bacterium]